MRRFVVSSRLLAVSVLILFGIGALVRASGSGFGCGDDWPMCSGAWLPPFEFKPIVEWSHRGWAAITGAISLAVAWFALRAPIERWKQGLAVGIVALIAIQAILGRSVVVAELSPTVLTFHFLVGVSIVAATTFLGVTANRSSRPSDASVYRMALGALIGLVILMWLGTFVRQEAAGLAITDWPLVDGGLIPDNFTYLTSIVWFHRLMAVVVGAHLFFLWRRARASTAGLAAAGSIVGATFLAQVLIGGANVLSELSQVTVFGHVFVGALTLSATVAVLALARTCGGPHE